MKDESGFEEWACSLERERLVDRHSVEVFAWAIEDEYEARLSEALEYFVDRPDYLMQECLEHLIELDRLETRFVGLEEYEKCAVVRDVKAELTIRYKQWM